MKDRVRLASGVVVACLVVGRPALAVSLVTQPSVNVAAEQVTVTWQTDVSATTELYFGPASEPSSAQYPNASAFTTLAGTLHSRTLRLLAPGPYYFRVRSSDGSGGATESSEGVFVVPTRTLLTRTQLGPSTLAYRSASLGSTLYLGGQFTFVGPPVGGGAVIDSSTGVPVADQPEVVGDVEAVIPDGNGGFYIGGRFQSVGGLPRSNAAHLLPDLGVDPRWSPSFDQPVLALWLSGSTVYAGGSFTSVNGSTPRSLLAAVDATTGAVLSFNPSVSGNEVEALGMSGSTLYLGGSFTQVGGSARNNAAAVNTTSGATTSWNPNASSDVLSLVVVGSTVYLGGNFVTLGGTTRNRAGAVDATAGAVTTWNPNANDIVEALAVSGSLVYLGGRFTTVNGGTSRAGLAAVDTSFGAVTTWNPAAPFSQVIALLVSGGKVYAAGELPNTSSGGVVTVDASTGAVVSLTTGNGVPFELAAGTTTQLYLGGAFTTLSTAPGALTRNNAAAIDLGTGQVTAWDPDLNRDVSALSAAGSTVYIGGDFTALNGGTALRSCAAAVDAQSGVATAWNPNANNWVYNIDVTGNRAYLAGTFTTVGGTVRNNAAAVDLTTGALLPWNPSFNSVVTSLVLDGTSAFAAGNFSTVNGISQPNVAKVDLDGGALLGWTPTLNGTGYALALDGNRLYATGSFTVVDGSDAGTGGVALDATTGALISWVTSVGGSQIAATPGRLYHTATVNSQESLVLSDATTGQPLWVFPAPPETILPACDAGFVAVQGEFSEVAGFSQAGLAVYPASTGCGPSAPTVTTFSPTAIEGTVSLHAALLPNLSDSTGWFRYATTNPGTCTDGFGTRIPAAGGFVMDGGANASAFSEALPPLGPGTYSLCALGSNAEGTSTGAVLSFVLSADGGLVVILPDGGTLGGGAPGARHLAVSCACASVGSGTGGLLLGLAFVLLWRLQRRRAS